MRLLSSWKVTIVRWNFTDMLKNLLSSWVTGKNHIALHSIMNTINAEPEGWSELALVVLMAPKRDVSVQVQVCEVCYLPTAVCPALALNLFFSSSSMPSICFGYCIVAQQLATPLVSTLSVPLPAETLQDYVVVTNYAIKSK